MTKLKYKWAQKLFGDHSRWLHFVVMFMPSILLVHFIKFWVIPLGVVVGVSWELYWMNKPGKFFDWWDVFWTEVASVFVLVIYLLIT